MHTLLVSESLLGTPALGEDVTGPGMMVSGSEDRTSPSGHQGEPPDRTDPALRASRCPSAFRAWGAPPPALRERMSPAVAL